MFLDDRFNFKNIFIFKIHQLTGNKKELFIRHKKSYNYFFIEF